MNSQHDLPPEAIEFWERALETWEDAAKKGQVDRREWVDIASQLIRAVKKADDAYFPRAHAHLAIVWLELGRDEEAAREANIALEQEPNEFRAQAVRVTLVWKKLKIRDVRPGDFIHLQHGVGEGLSAQVASSVIFSALGSVAKSVVTGIDVGLSVHRSSTAKGEIERLGAIFTNVCSVNPDVDEFLYMSNSLIRLGDLMKKIPMAGGRPDLYAAVFYAPIDKLNQLGRDTEVRQVRQQAERRLFQDAPERS